MRDIRIALSPSYLAGRQRKRIVTQSSYRRSCTSSRRSVSRTVVHARGGGGSSSGVLRFEGDFSMTFPVALGRSGIASKRKEGDGVTPLGRYFVRGVLYHADRVRRPRTGVPCFALQNDDFWCDVPHYGLYNRFVRRFGGALHLLKQSDEHLLRDDGVYDLIVVLSFNDCPPIPRRGSAVFIHVARSGFEPTAGCIALRKKDLCLFISRLRATSFVDIQTAQIRRSS